MPRKPDERIEKAKELFLQGVKLVEISTMLGLPEGTVRRWKSTHQWDNERSGKEASVRKRGGQKGNRNATGPPGNKNAEKHGLFSKFLPKETLAIIQEMPKDPLDVLWNQIQIAYAAILRAQQIMYVTDKDDKTVQKVGESTSKVVSEKWEVQQAWDKHANFLKSQARAQGELRSMIKQYDDLLHKNWELATEEQKARIANLKAQTSKVMQDQGVDDDGVVIINDAPKETD